MYDLYGDYLEYVNMNNPFPPGEFNGTWHSLIRDDCGEWKKKIIKEFTGAFRL